MNLTSKLSVGVLVLSTAGLALIQRYEGTELSAYLDPVQVPTICTGHTTGVYVGQKATLAECEEFLVQDSTYAGEAVQRCTTVPLTQQQYDALVSFTFNVGAGAYCRSTLLKKLNQGDCRGAAGQFQRWVYAQGVPLRGLKTRRAAEAELFLKGCE